MNKHKKHGTTWCVSFFILCWSSVVSKWLIWVGFRHNLSTRAKSQFSCWSSVGFFRICSYQSCFSYICLHSFNQTDRSYSDNILVHTTRLSFVSRLFQTNLYLNMRFTRTRITEYEKETMNGKYVQFFYVHSCLFIACCCLNELSVVDTFIQSDLHW